MPCMCGDLYCLSCGPAQGNGRCYNCGAWEMDGGCENPEACEKRLAEIARDEADRVEEEKDLDERIELWRMKQETPGES